MTSRQLPAALALMRLGELHAGHGHPSLVILGCASRFGELHAGHGHLLIRLGELHAGHGHLDSSFSVVRLAWVSYMQVMVTLDSSTSAARFVARQQRRRRRRGGRLYQSLVESFVRGIVNEVSPHAHTHATRVTQIWLQQMSTCILV